ncbi:cytochrome c biogenesis protein CcsA [Glaciecola sp. MH2013]|uniref:cytochrome C assembly family protein n=1 Tax=Glaciecola sp. MH2013 TaxID=2785524 RepID=UPI00189EF9BF|nr:cytochrome c biogenesis protein CcsA [Glaciecola sp. MH2013]MBF7073257.1 cytochrome c biogenesis protein CcsA [Glaciecola sp. MH2013]
MDLSLALYLPTLCLYIWAGIGLSKAFFSHKENTSKLPILLLVAASIGHLALIVNSNTTNSAEHLSITQVAALLAWLVTVTMLITNTYIKNLVFLPVVSLFSALFISLQEFVPQASTISINMSAGMISHIVLSLFAFGVLSISFLYALQLAYINYQLKHKQISLMNSALPPLMSVEHILIKLMIFGTILLAIALFSGFVFIPNMFADGYAHKTILSSTAFLLYIVALALQHVAGLKARTLVTFNLFGVALLTLAYFGSRFVKEILL